MKKKLYDRYASYKVYDFRHKTVTPVVQPTPAGVSVFVWNEDLNYLITAGRVSAGNLAPGTQADKSCTHLKRVQQFIEN